MQMLTGLRYTQRYIASNSCFVWLCDVSQAKKKRIPRSIFISFTLLLIYANATTFLRRLSSDAKYHIPLIMWGYIYTYAVQKQ